MLEPGVSGTLTLKLKNVTVPEVLDAVRDAYGYDYRKMATGYVIVPPALQTRMFQINYLDLERRGTSRTRVTSGQISQGGTQQPSTTQAGSSSGALPQSSGLSEPPGAVFGRGNDGRGTSVADITGTSISTRSSSDFWHDLEASLRSFVGTDGGRTASSSIRSPASSPCAARRANCATCRSSCSKIQSVSTRQVVLEAKILEVELSDGMQAGINWAYLGHNGATTIAGVQTGPQQGFGNNTFSAARPVQPAVDHRQPDARHSSPISGSRDQHPRRRLRARGHAARTSPPTSSC